MTRYTISQDDFWTLLKPSEEVLVAYWLEELQSISAEELRHQGHSDVVSELFEVHARFCRDKYGLFPLQVYGPNEEPDLYKLAESLRQYACTYGALPTRDH